MFGDLTAHMIDQIGEAGVFFCKPAAQSPRGKGQLLAGPIAGPGARFPDCREWSHGSGQSWILWHNAGPRAVRFEQSRPEAARRPSAIFIMALSGGTEWRLTGLPKTRVHRNRPLCRASSRCAHARNTRHRVPSCLPRRARRKTLQNMPIVTSASCVRPTIRSLEIR